MDPHISFVEPQLGLSKEAPAVRDRATPRVQENEGRTGIWTLPLAGWFGGSGSIPLETACPAQDAVRSWGASQACTSLVG
jgi:hypothetical protein